MINKDLLKYTISDLIIKSIYEDNNLYIDEIKKRLYYCGFSPNVIDEVIKTELKLVTNKKNELFSSKRLINDNFKLSSVSIKKMMLSELLGLIDGAVMINNYFSNDYSYEIIKEIESISTEDMKNVLFQEFYNRIESSFRKANNLKLKFKGYVYEEQIGKLYENEMQIILKNRWSDILEVEESPYEEVCR